MGSRGASSGKSDYGNEYGSQYETLLEEGNIKFIKKKNRQSESLMETMTPGRIYVKVGGTTLQSIVYFDEENKRSKQIDLDHEHKKTQPHVHRGYEHHEYDENEEHIQMTPEEAEMVDKVKEIWDNHLRKKR